jgi:hypothetical protein
VDPRPFCCQSLNENRLTCDPGPREAAQPHPHHLPYALRWVGPPPALPVSAASSPLPAGCTMSSMPSFDFLTAGRIQFGSGKLATVPALLSSMGVSKVLIVKDGRPGADDALKGEWPVRAFAGCVGTGASGSVALLPAAALWLLTGVSAWRCAHWHTQSY